MAESDALLDWRKRQKRGGIMAPATFKKIEKGAAKRGARDPKAVAGKSYWQAARSKFGKTRKKKRMREM